MASKKKQSSKKNVLKWVEAFVAAMNEQGKIQLEVYHDLRELLVAIKQNPELISTLKNPKFNLEQKKEFLSNLIQQKAFPEYLKNVLFLMLQKGQIGILLGFLESAAQEVLKKINYQKVIFYMARPFSQEYLDEIKEKLQKKFKRNIILELVHQPDLMAGIKIFSENKVIDLSIDKKIKDLFQKLSVENKNL